MASRSFARRVANKLASALPVTLSEVSASTDDSPVSLVQAFGVLFSNAANFTYEIPPEAVTSCCRRLGLQPSRHLGVTNRALQHAGDYTALRRRLFVRLADHLRRSENFDLTAALEAIYDLEPGCVARVRVGEAYTIVPSNAHAQRSGGAVYSFAQGSCGIVAASIGGQIFLAHYERKRTDDLGAAATSFLEQAKDAPGDVYVVGLPSLVDAVTSLPVLRQREYRLWRHVKPMHLLYNLKVIATPPGLTFYKSAHHAESLYDGDFRRYGWDMASAFEPEPLRFM